MKFAGSSGSNEQIQILNCYEQKVAGPIMKMTLPKLS